MSARENQRIIHQTNARNLHKPVKGQIQRMIEAANSGDLSHAESLTLEDRFYELAELVGQGLAAAKASAASADATETKVAARAAKEAAKVA